MERLGAEKVIYNADRLVDIKNTGDAYPVHMVVGLTDYCNHSCIFCNTEFATADSTRVHTIDRKVLIRFLKEAQSVGLKAVTLVGSGEPLIHPEIEQVLYDIHDIGLEIGIFTNGARLTENVRKAVLDTCTFVRCSINASNSQEHETVHRVKNQFENIVNNVQALVNERQKTGRKLPTIGTQFVFYEENYRSIVEATKLWKRIGADYFEVKPLIEGEGSSVGTKVFAASDNEAVMEQMKLAKELADESFQVYAKYGQYLKTISANKRKYSVCYGHALDPNLWSDGNMYICSNHEHEEDIIGNIYENSFDEIWHGEKRKKRIQQINVSQCPRGCRCDLLNEVIWDYLHPDILVHPNFI
jgi:radical SAM protein with 4Fe4S-binding SPASM domain